MLSRRERALVRSLRKGRERSAEGLFITSGLRTVKEILAADALSGGVRFALTSPRLQEMPGGAALLEHLTVATRVERVSDEEMAELSPTRSHQGVLAVCRLPGDTLQALALPTATPILVLDGVQDPGNVGTLVRSAVAFTASAVVCLEGCADPFGPKAVRSSAGLVFRVPVVRSDTDGFLSWCGRHGVRLWVADADGEALTGPLPESPWGLVLGGEGTGVRGRLREVAARVVRVAMSGPAESLNVAMAGSILLHLLDTLRVEPGTEDNL